MHLLFNLEVNFPRSTEHIPILPELNGEFANTLPERLEHFKCICNSLKLIFTYVHMTL